MEFFANLWLPILLSSAFVFVVSSVVHMVLPFHKGDYKRLPGEDKVLDALRGQSVPPGSYMFPCPQSMKDWKSPEMIEKYKQGPVGYMTVVPSAAPGMGKNLAQWFGFSLLIGIFAGYIGMLGLGWGAEYRSVFRVTGTVAILGYAVSNIPDSIWRGQRWSVTLMFIVDGVIYGLVTAGTFGWLWPGGI